MSLMTDQTRRSVEQARMDELSGKYAHSQLLKMPRLLTKASEALCILIPIVYFMPSDLVKAYLGGDRAAAVLAVLLLALSITRNIFRWDDALISHRTFMAKSLVSASRALEILNNPDATEEEAREYLRGQAIQSTEEMALFENMPIDVRQYSYREALKEVIPGEIDHAICHKCKKSVWDFKNGACQLCGGNG
jgi:mobilome CxxCx(11)CxxC protein